MSEKLEKEKELLRKRKEDADALKKAKEAERVGIELEKHQKVQRLLAEKKKREEEEKIREAMEEKK